MKNGDLELHRRDITNANNEPASNGNIKRDKEPVSWMDKIRAAIAFLTIEPFLLCYIFPMSVSSMAVQRLNLEKACLVDLNYSMERCNGSDENATTQMQTLVADMTTWQVPLTSAIPAIAILFVGAWSDRTGNRKALMLIPIFGELVSSFGLVLTTYYFYEWPLFVTALIEALPSALSGGFSIALMGAYSYLADVTSVESRTFRIGIAAVLVTLSAPAAIALSGILLDTIGYFGIFGLTTALYMLGFMYTYFRIHDVNPIKIEGTLYSKLVTFVRPKNVWDTLCIAFKPGPNRAKILLVLVAYVVIMGPVFGEGAMLYQYLVLKYEMSSVEISLYVPYSILVGICGTAVAVIFFTKYLKMHDALLGIIATTSKIVSSCVYGLAPTKPWFYSGPVFDFFGGVGVTAIRSLGTKVVEPEQVAKMASLIGLVEAITPVIYTPMYSQMYKNTIKTLPGAFYLLGAAMTVPAVFVFIFIYVQYKKEERDRVTDPESKEKYAHENYITKF